MNSLETLIPSKKATHVYSTSGEKINPFTVDYYIYNILIINKLWIEEKQKSNLWGIGLPDRVKNGCLKRLFPIVNIVTGPAIVCHIGTVRI
jgi:hypothetical protein